MPTTPEQFIQSNEPLRPVVLERKPDVIRRTGFSNSALYAAVSRGIFPRPVSLGTGRAVAWVQSEVDSYIAARIAARNASEAAE
jgi:prophage regulatory protein